ncbi:hypothetical protein [Streptomyces sp. NPDC051554]|uniref:hypothetical protein n=1 Tax=Streptomyces sp. NPDC051554 TaxID=3365656 RepID=UPI0037993273
MYPDYDTPRLTGPYLAIHTERAAQKGRLGAEHHDLPEWALALTEHVGKFTGAVIASVRHPDDLQACVADIRQEALATGAGIVALLEYLDTLESTPT